MTVADVTIPILGFDFFNSGDGQNSSSTYPNSARGIEIHSVSSKVTFYELWFFL